ncbi:MAG: hypothetical protein R2699_03180 [Acidimicrobiales bacterium]
MDHVRDWTMGTADGDWVSMAVCSDGSYGVPEGLISSFPVTTAGGTWSIVQGLEHNAYSQGKIDATVAELGEERDTARRARPDRRRSGGELAVSDASSAPERGLALLEELAGRVVGQDLAAGLARGAVVSRCSWRTRSPASSHRTPGTAAPGGGARRRVDRRSCSCRGAPVLLPATCRCSGGSPRRWRPPAPR